MGDTVMPDLTKREVNYIGTSAYWFLFNGGADDKLEGLPPQQSDAAYLEGWWSV